MAEYIDVGPELETDADRRLKEWEALRDGCPARYQVVMCSINAGLCEISNCFERHWR